jgi:hypothetical protein
MNRVLVCTKCKGSKPLLRFLRDEDIAFKALDCQKLCENPVAACEVRGQLEWFAAVRKPKQYRALAALARGATVVPSTLEKRWVEKRSGRGPR